MEWFPDQRISDNYSNPPFRFNPKYLGIVQKFKKIVEKVKPLSVIKNNVAVNCGKQ